MNNQMLGLLLIAGAALLIFGRRTSGAGTPQQTSGTGTPQQTSGAGAPTPTSGAGAPRPASGTGAPQTTSGTAATQQTSGSGVQVYPESTGTPPPDEILEEAALYPEKAYLAGDWRYSWHAWNYYRAQAAIKAGLCDSPCSEYAPVLGERFGLTDSQGLTAAEYHAYLSQGGFSGLSAWRYRQHYRRPWQ